MQICHSQGKHSPNLICSEPPPKGDREGFAAMHILSSILREAQACSTASPGSSEPVLRRAPEPPVRTESLWGTECLLSWHPADQEQWHWPWRDLWGTACPVTPGGFVLLLAARVWPSRITWVWKLESFFPIGFLFPFLPCFSLVLVFVFFFLVLLGKIWHLEVHLF